MKITIWKSVAILGMIVLPLGAMAQGKPAVKDTGKPKPPAAAPSSLDEALKQAPKLDAKLVPLDKAYATAATKLKKSPKDAAAKKAYVTAAYTYGSAAEYSETLSPKIRYRAALLLYRKALAVDPKHKESLAEKQKIEDIYKGMPGGIPK